MSKRILIIAAVVILLGMHISAVTRDSISIDTLDAGLIYKDINRYNDTLNIHILKIDLKNNDFSFEAMKGGETLTGREKTSSMFNRSSDSLFEAIAAINGDFFIITEGGEPENNMICNGIFIKGVDTTDSVYDIFDNIHSQFALTKDNKPLIEKFGYEGELLTPDKRSIRIKRINGKTNSSSITIYNHFHGEKTPIIIENAYLEIVVSLLNSRKDTMIGIIKELFLSSGGTKLNKGELIISLRSYIKTDLLNSLKREDTLILINKIKPELLKIYNLVGGWPRIVNDGENIALRSDSLEGIFPAFSNKRHPRTGIGFTKDSTLLIWFVVDGRQENSRGMTLNEFADLMLEEDVYQGLNLDGGGSSTMVINEKIINNPSDENGERKVGNCLILKRKRNTK